MRPETPPSFTETSLLLPGPEQSNSLGTGMLLATLRRRVVGPLAATATFLGASVLPATQDMTELAIRDTEIAIDQGPQLDFHDATASEAVTQTYQAFHLGNGYYIDAVTEISGYATTWHQFQLLNMFDVANTLYPGQGYDQKLNEALNALNSSYWNDSPAGYPAGYDASRNFGMNTTERYVDDNLWMAQLLLRQYQKTGDQTYLDRVGSILDLFISQHDPDNGGAYWKVQLPAESDQGRVMASNATAIPTLVEMYLYGADVSYLTAAEQTFAWVQQLYDPITGLYFDNFMANGEIETIIYTYNQAEVLNAMVELNKINSGRYPLSDAVRLAETSMDYFSEHSSYGIGKFDVIYLKSLMQLASKVNDPTMTTQVQRAITLAKNATQDSLGSSADAAAAATIISLSELPLSDWSRL